MSPGLENILVVAALAAASVSALARPPAPPCQRPAIAAPHTGLDLCTEDMRPRRIRLERCRADAMDPARARTNID